MRFMKNFFTFSACLALFFSAQANASVAQVPIFLFDKEGNPRCQIAGTGEHDDYLLSERLAEFVKNAPEDIRPFARELADLKECDENDALYAGVELNPEEIRAAAAINPISGISRNALMATGVYLVGLWGACPVGQLNNKYFGEGTWVRFWGGVAWGVAVSLSFQHFVPIKSFLLQIVGAMPVLGVHHYCHKNASN